MCRSVRSSTVVKITMFEILAVRCVLKLLSNQIYAIGSAVVWLCAVVLSWQDLGGQPASREEKSNSIQRETRQFGWQETGFKSKRSTAGNPRNPELWVTQRGVLWSAECCGKSSAVLSVLFWRSSAALALLEILWSVV